MTTVASTCDPTDPGGCFTSTELREPTRSGVTLTSSGGGGSARPRVGDPLPGTVMLSWDCTTAPVVLDPLPLLDPLPVFPPDDPFDEPPAELPPLLEPPPPPPPPPPPGVVTVMVMALEAAA